jgi:bifunctional UDP-N-acetylglucosamine pyrophosphorylase/glucosamine-1-phosphate N-acetyltransferase
MLIDFGLLSETGVAVLKAKRSVAGQSGAMPLTVIILAAGQGKRMKSRLPKVLQPLAGRPLLKHVIDTAQALQPRDIHVVYGHGGEQVREALKSERVSWVGQREQLGTGHAVMQALPQLPDDRMVLVLYGDVPLIRRGTLEALVRLAGAHSIGLLTMLLDDAAGYGRIVRDARGRVRRIVEQKDASKAQLKIREGNTGVMAVPAKLLKKYSSKLKNKNAQREYYLTDIVAMAVKDRIEVRPLIAPTVAEVLGVNDKAQLAEVEALRRAQVARDFMLAGVLLADPARLDVRGVLQHGDDVSLDVNVVLEGDVELGHRVRIGPNCFIRNAQIGDDSEVQANCVIDGASIGQACIVGPFARIRPGTTLARGAHIGNFVEVKNSRVGEGSKANHLTYLGDSVVGKDVNVGAGTVTCNYDGANKSQTHIEDGAFIGSGSMLVAPVRIGASATIGAGSTITKDAPSGQLTLERSQQISIEGWKRPVKKKG